MLLGYEACEAVHVEVCTVRCYSSCREAFVQYVEHFGSDLFVDAGKGEGMSFQMAGKSFSYTASGLGDRDMSIL